MLTEAVQPSLRPDAAADRLRTIALQGLSHDLREPIRTILCYSELIGQSEAIRKDPNLVGFVHLVSSAATRMNALVDGMLRYSSLLGAEAPFPLPVDMNAVVQTALANLHSTIEETGAVIVADTLPEVYGDQTQLTELVQNLVSNSLKYRGAQQPQIHIRCEGSGDQFLFSVQDNGQGIDPVYQESIFSPFKRLHGRNIPGVGLGLAICRQIADLHHGRIWVESEPGHGSTFRFALPSQGPEEFFKHRKS
jgi:light-regulated signal transduction histidine kinase (bacteriophytochrome)